VDSDNYEFSDEFIGVLLNKDGFSSPLFDFETFVNMFFANADSYKYLKFGEENWGPCQNPNFKQKRKLKEVKPSEFFTDREQDISSYDPF
jgi:hypothetical protein